MPTIYFLEKQLTVIAVIAKNRQYCKMSAKRNCCEDNSMHDLVSGFVSKMI